MTIAIVRAAFGTAGAVVVARLGRMAEAAGIALVGGGTDGDAAAWKPA